MNIKNPLLSKKGAFCCQKSQKKHFSSYYSEFWREIHQKSSKFITCSLATEIHRLRIWLKSESIEIQKKNCPKIVCINSSNIERYCKCIKNGSACFSSSRSLKGERYTKIKPENMTQIRNETPNWINWMEKYFFIRSNCLEISLVNAI